MLTNMRGTIADDPKLKFVKNPRGDGQLKVASCTLNYQKEPTGGKTPVSCDAWGDAADALAAHKKGDEIEFVANLTYAPFWNKTKEDHHNILGFTIIALDKAKTLCSEMEKFMGVEASADEKPGTVFQPMRGKLLDTPELREITGRDGQPLKACNAVLRFWNGKPGIPDAFVSISAYGKTAQELAAMKKDDLIQFVGRLDSRPYTNKQMDHSIMELCYNVVSLDPDRNLVKATDEFLRKKFSLREPLRNRVKEAQDRSEANAASKEQTPERKVPEAVK